MDGLCANEIGRYGEYGSPWMKNGKFDQELVLVRPVEVL